MNQSILLVDDDFLRAQQVGLFLQQSGFDLNLIYDGMRALESVHRQKYDLLLLDWMLPEISGIDLCKEIRKTSSVPIIMLTAKGEETDKIVSLELGADDYMTKPYSLKELLARIRSLLRRSTKSDNTSEKYKKVIVREFPHFKIVESSHELFVDGFSIGITRSEFDLLGLFCSNPGHVFSRDILLEHITGNERGAYDCSVDIHISNIRKKIEPESKTPLYLKTVWGVGYRFDLPA